MLEYQKHHLKEDWKWVIFHSRYAGAGLVLQNKVWKKTNTTTEEAPLLLEFHILFHSLYQIPILYCRGQELDGRSVDINTLFSFEDTQLVHQIWMTEEHPCLEKESWYTLHACAISNALPTTPKEAIFAWFSLMAPLLKITIKEEVVGKVGCIGD